MGDAALVEELTAKLASLQAEKEKESEDRNYAQLERDKIDSFWEITKAELEECKASLRVKDREAEELEERHRVEIKVYKQKVKHLLYEHQNDVSRIKTDAETALKAQQDDFRKRTGELSEDKRSLKLEMKETELAHEDIVRSLKLDHAKEITKLRSEFERNADELKALYERKQKTLREEMDSVTAQGIYQDYLMFCMQGDTVNAPMGVQITIERDQSEFTRLTQLGDILGLNQMEVGSVHKGLADKAFRAQAEQMLADGKGLTAERAEKLKEIQTSLSLPEADAQKIIKGITSKKMLSAMQAQIAMGTLSIADVRKMKEEGVEIDNVISPDKRMQLFRKNAESRLTDGSGAADIEALSVTLPADLGIEPGKAKTELLKIANDKKRSTMVAAVAELRQEEAESFAGYTALPEEQSSPVPAVPFKSQEEQK